MHKSKNYDMATQVAMDKLMPKPIQITISMQGGGGLRGLGERPVSSVYGRPIPRTIYRQYGGMSDWGISSADMEAAYSTGAFGPELAQESFFDPPDIESQRVHGTSPHDFKTHGEAYGKPPGSQPAASSGLDDFTGVGGQPSPEMQRRKEIRRQEGLRGMMQGGFDSPQAYRDYMRDWESEAAKSKSDAYWAKNPYGNWVTETFGGTKGTSLVLPEQAPISKNDAINNVLEDDTLSSEEKQEQIDYIFTWGPVVNRDMGRLKTARRQRRDDMKARARAQGYSPTQNKNKGGGLSSVKKSININGQPHKLAWIRPDEASALRAMGGSGRKVGGVPAYFFFDQGGSPEVTGGGDPEAGVDWASDVVTYTDMTQDPGSRGGQSFEDENVYTTTTTDQREGFDPSNIWGGSDDWEGADIVAGDAKKTLEKEIARDDEGPTDIRKGFLGLWGDTMTRGEALEGAKRSAFTTWRNTVGKYSTDTPKDYEEWFAAQDPNALIAGYKIGDPVGMAMQSSFDNVNKQLKKKFKDARDDKAVTLDDDEEFEMTREELGEIVESAKVEGLEDFTPYSGIDYPVWMPGGMLAAGMDFLSRTVIGTGTVGGVGVHLHKDGSITPISPEDSPGFDHESMKGENVEPVRRRKQRGGFGFEQKDVEKLQEEPLTGMSGLLAKRGPAATRAEGLASLKKGVLPQVYTEEQIEDFNLA